MACCLAAPSHYMIQCWLVIIWAPWQSLRTNYIWRAQYALVNWKYAFRITFMFSGADELIRGFVFHSKAITLMVISCCNIGSVAKINVNLKSWKAHPLSIVWLFWNATQSKSFILRCLFELQYDWRINKFVVTGSWTRFEFKINFARSSYFASDQKQRH